MDHGNPNLSRFALSLMEQISKPYFRLMSRWLHEGVLDDPHGEFFVSQPSSQSLSSDEQNVWQSKFQLIPTEAPAFLPSPLVDKIFRLGKSLDFIRQVCGERVFVQSRRVPRELAYAALMDNRLADAIKADYKAISRHLLQLVYEKYKLPMHLITLKQFLLLGQGDFIQNLLEILA
jgi:gamma-tubulin complex component 3